MINEILVDTIKIIGERAEEILNVKRNVNTDLWAKKMSIDLVHEISVYEERFTSAYNLLEDENSKNIFKWFIKFKIAYAFIGAKAELIFPYTEESYQALKKLDSINYENIEGFMKCVINGYTIKTTNAVEIYHTWIQNQYSHENNCVPLLDENIICGGAFHGETAIWFADKVGERGKIYAFEADPDNFKTLQDNITMNDMNEIISCQNYGFWNEDKNIYIKKNIIENAASCTEDKNEKSINGIKIDTFVCRNNIQQIDFIQLDIEGAELRALEGAVETLKRFKPKLAISVYHKKQDIYEIPIFIKTIVPEYKLYLSHKSVSWYETTLFAVI